jgi:hypothetical protein
VIQQQRANQTGQRATDKESLPRFVALTAAGRFVARQLAADVLQYIGRCTTMISQAISSKLRPFMTVCPGQQRRYQLEVGTPQSSVLHADALKETLSP